MTNSIFKGQGLVQMTKALSGSETVKTVFTKEAIERLKDDLGKFHIKVGVYQIHGRTYHELRPTGWMNAGDTVSWNGMMDWASENFGPTPDDGVWTPSARWYANNARFYFQNLEDRDWFLLRWAQ